MPEVPIYHWTILTSLFTLFAPCNNAVDVGFIQAHGLINDAISLDGIGMGTCFIERLAINLGGKVVDVGPLQDRATDGGYLILSIRIEIIADTLPLRAIIDILQGHRQLQGLHEESSANHVIVIEGSPTRIGVLMPQLALAMQKRRVFRQVLAIHNQVLPVHIDL